MALIDTKFNAKNVNNVFRLLVPTLIILWVVFFLHVGKQNRQALRGPFFESKVATSDPTKAPSQFDHLVVVTGHAVVNIMELENADTRDDAWYLLAYQRNQGFPQIITSHIQKGIDMAEQETRAMLVFSGGESRKDVGPISEAASYYYLAMKKTWMHSGLIPRVYLEEYARDSFENLLFSICRFREVSGTYPERISVIGFDFKEHRFTELHRQAIYFPKENFTYVGLIPETTLFDHAKAVEGEHAAYASFQKDLYGCNDFALAHKRVSRNPFKRTIPYELACPEMKELLHYCGSELIDPKYIPWNHSS